MLLFFTGSWKLRKEWVIVWISVLFHSNQTQAKCPCQWIKDIYKYIRIHSILVLLALTCNSSWQIIFLSLFLFLFIFLSISLQRKSLYIHIYTEHVQRTLMKLNTSKMKKYTNNSIIEKKRTLRINWVPKHIFYLPPPYQFCALLPNSVDAVVWSWAPQPRKLLRMYHRTLLRKENSHVIKIC